MIPPILSPTSPPRILVPIKRTNIYWHPRCSKADLSSFNQQTFVVGVAVPILQLKELGLQKDNSCRRGAGLNAPWAVPAHPPAHLQSRLPAAEATWNTPCKCSRRGRFLPLMGTAFSAPEALRGAGASTLCSPRAVWTQLSPVIGILPAGE